MKGFLYFFIVFPIYAVEFTLINGKTADLKDWPASVYATMGSSRCTATVIGEKVLLIAAHCVGDGKSATFSVKGNSYKSLCTHSPHYRNNTTADWALCIIDNNVQGIPYEVVNQDPEIHKVGQNLQLTGYGCTNPGGGGGNDGTYRIGESNIIDLPSGSNNDIVTRGGGSAALCFGDSGGPAFLWDAKKEKRLVVSVNSRGDIKAISNLSSISTSMAKTFFSDWSSRNKVEICGIHTSARGCRSMCSQPIAFLGSDVTIQRGDWTSIGSLPIVDQIYQWTPEEGLDDPTSAMPIASPNKTTVYTLKTTNKCATVEKTIKITVID